MNFAQSLNSEIAVADCQLSPEQLQQAAQSGFRSVLNLRSPQEEGTLADEAAHAEAAGLTYVNVPVSPSDLNDSLTDRVMQAMDDLPKPLLTHCKSGMRSGAMALMYLATRHNMTAESALEKGQQNGFNCDAHPDMKQYFVHYIDSHTNANGVA